MDVDYQPNLIAFDGLRGIGAILITLGHFSTLWADGPFPMIGPDYLSAVTLFFVISGFTMVVVYDRGISPLEDWTSKKEFFKKRVGRLVPLYYLSLLIALPDLLLYNSSDIILPTVLLTVFWVQSLTGLIGTSWNGPLWTVSAFVFCYLLFPWLLHSLRKRSIKHLKIITTVTGLVSIVVTLGLIFYTKASLLMHLQVFFRIPQFVLGMCFGLLCKRQPFKNPTWIAETCFLIAILSQACAITICELFRSPDDFTRAYGYWFLYNYIIEFVCVFHQGLWLMALASPECKGLGFSILSHPVLQFLGKISFALYTIHWPCIQWIAFTIAGGVSYQAVPKDGGAWRFFHWWHYFPILGLLLLLATLVHYVVEAPSRRWIASK
ncbi:acyltransferase 3 [Gorgonomyces haynaldii]|nr:acyltransferase 3 [Gorgonomyces haynaldii]